jgi:hypothetical protein
MAFSRAGMVWGRMGLLDDAIREHLEFKRLRGADPSEVAREEQEALGAVHRGQDFGPDSSPDPHTDGSVRAGGDARGEDHSPAVATSPASGNLTHAGQETAELDMRTVMAAGGVAGEDMPGDSLEWEIASHASDEPPGETHEADESTGTSSTSAEEVEDVLEETPDFLRETPDQERLWFEQQPPRDFDFDK